MLAALAAMLITASSALADDPVDLRDTTCPDCAVPLLRDPEPETSPRSEDRSNSAEDQGRSEAEAYREEWARQQSGQQ
jgi:hypothetical protein